MGDSTFKISEKSAGDNMPKKLNPIVILLVVIAIMLVLIVGLEIKTNAITNLIFGYNKVGVTIGNNNNNFGYAVKQGKWIYYMTLSEDANSIDINRIRTDGTKREVLAEKDWEIYSLNAYGKYLYFIALDQATDPNVYMNNKIYKMSLDGKELRVINDNKFSDDCQAIYVVNDRIYYIGEDYNIYSMDLEGGTRTKVSDNKTGYIGITNKYIIYNDLAENPKSKTDFITYIMNIDGTGARIVNGDRLYNPNIVGDYIYYVNSDNSEIHRMDVTGKNDTLIYKSPAYNMNVYGDYIYYLNYKNENADSNDEVVCIHRVRTDGTDHKIVCEMVNYSSFINIAGDWVYYTDHDDEKYYIKMTKTDGSDTVNLFEFAYNVPTTTTNNTTNTTVDTTNTVEAENTVTNETTSNTVEESTSKN